jgi:hypothetical protein
VTHLLIPRDPELSEGDRGTRSTALDSRKADPSLALGMRTFHSLLPIVLLLALLIPHSSLPERGIPAFPKRSSQRLLFP